VSDLQYVTAVGAARWSIWGKKYFAERRGN